jgi:hypothetical protein
MCDYRRAYFSGIQSIVVRDYMKMRGYPQRPQVRHLSGVKPLLLGESNLLFLSYQALMK